MRTYYTLFLFLFLGVACSEAQNTENYSLVSTQEFSKMVEDESIQLIDVRTPGEYGGGTIAHAENIDYLGGNFEAKVKELNLEQPIYLFCQSGGRSKKASDQLLKLGAKEVIELDGGYGAWQSR